MPRSAIPVCIRSTGNLLLPLGQHALVSKPLVSTFSLLCRSCPKWDTEFVAGRPPPLPPGVANPLRHVDKRLPFARINLLVDGGPTEKRNQSMPARSAFFFCKVWGQAPPQSHTFLALTRLGICCSAQVHNRNTQEDPGLLCARSVSPAAKALFSRASAVGIQLAGSQACLSVIVSLRLLAAPTTACRNRGGVFAHITATDQSQK